MLDRSLCLYKYMYGYRYVYIPLSKVHRDTQLTVQSLKNMCTYKYFDVFMNLIIKVVKGDIILLGEVRRDPGVAVWNL